MLLTCQRILGLCALPLVGWLASGNWFIISLITGPPTILVIFGWKLLPESPRWLLSRPNRISEAETIFKRMAEVNGKDVPKNLNQSGHHKQMILISES